MTDHRSIRLFKRQPRILIKVWLLALSLAIASPGNVAFTNNPIGPSLSAFHSLFGVINDDGLHYNDQWARGVRATTFEFQWKLYEPQEGIYDQSYINHMKQILTDLKNQGWYVQMIPGYHYAPEWVFTNYQNVYYINQYGEQYNPNSVTQGDFRVINAPFNPQARALIAGYIQRIFQDFDQNNPSYKFNSVRVGGGVQGELRYPPEVWNGHTNAYWAFDNAAQNPAVSGILPSVQGWRPGIDPNPGSVNRGQLLVNPGFEQNHVNYGILGWSPDDQVTSELTSTDPHGGTRALKLTISSANRTHQYVRVSPGTTYNLSGWLKSGDGTGRARIFITQYDSNWVPVANAPFLKIQSRSLNWVQQTGTLTISPSTSVLKVEMDGDRAGTYYFDDLQLRRDGETNQQNRVIDVPLNFYDWYVQSMTNYQNWQISEIRKAYQGQLDIVYAGKGVRSYQIVDALTNDLRGDGWSERGSALYAAADYARHVDELSTYQNIALYVTGIEVPSSDQVNDSSPYPGDWSAARWLAQIARNHRLNIWGENTGRNNSQEMSLSIQRMRANGFVGFMWAIESELYASPNPNNYATIDDYESFIQTYANLKTILIPFAVAHP